MFLVIQSFFLIAAAKRIVAIGDIHGDYEVFTNILRRTNFLTENNTWTNTQDILVQTGDLVDRGPDTIKIFDLIGSLFTESDIEFHYMLGNHEVMNLGGDWRYVSDEDIHSFGPNSSLHEKLLQRSFQFSKDGKIGNIIRKFAKTAVNINGNVFVHGGIVPDLAQHGLSSINSFVSDRIQNEDWKNPILGSSGPLWYRGFAEMPEYRICSDLKKSLSLLNATRMIIGHTITPNRRITSRCDDQVVLIDVALSSYYGSTSSEWAALEIIGNELVGLYSYSNENLHRVDVSLESMMDEVASTFWTLGI